MNRNGPRRGARPILRPRAAMPETSHRHRRTARTARSVTNRLRSERQRHVSLPRHFSSLDELAETLGNLIGNPVTIENTDFHLIAYSQQIQVDATRTETILRKSGPPEFVRWLNRSRLLKRIYESRVPIRIPRGPSGEFDGRVAVAIHGKNRILGHIWVLETQRKTTGDDLRLLTQAAGTASLLLLRQEVEKSIYGTLLRAILNDNLENEIDSERTVRRRAKALGIDLPDLCVVLVVLNDFAAASVDATNDAVTIEGRKADLLNAVRASALEADEHPVSLLHGNTIVVILGAAQATEVKRAALGERGRRLAAAMNATLRQHFPHLRPFVGVSDVLPSVKLSHAYSQAEVAAAVCRDLLGTRNLAEYKDLGVFRLLHILQSRNQTEGYQNAHLQRLEAYDAQHKASFVRTLEVYLDNMGQLVPTAATLHIHTNTLAYRIKRICEIGMLELSEPLQRISVHLEIKLRRMQM